MTKHKRSKASRKAAPVIYDLTQLVNNVARAAGPIGTAISATDTIDTIDAVETTNDDHQAAVQASTLAWPSTIDTIDEDYDGQVKQAAMISNMVQAANAINDDSSIFQPTDRSQAFISANPPTLDDSQINGFLDKIDFECDYRSVEYMVTTLLESWGEGMGKSEYIEKIANRKSFIDDLAVKYDITFTSKQCNCIGELMYITMMEAMDYRSDSALQRRQLEEMAIEKQRISQLNQLQSKQ
jgi:hypothetical protein